MIRRSLFLVLMASAWVLIFQLERLVFFTYQFFETSRQPIRFLAESALHGLRMDVSFSAYLIAIPTLLMGFTAHHWHWYRHFLSVFYGAVSFLVALIVTSDLEVYRSWGFRLDYTPIRYLAHPNEVAASVSSSPLLLLVIVFFISIYLINHYTQKLIRYHLDKWKKTNEAANLFLFLFLTALLIIPIRGGLQLAPINQSAVYYSSNNFANQLAINAPWNFFSSLVNKTGRRDNPFVAMPDQEAEAICNSLLPPYPWQSQPGQLKDRPNVILIIWESFTAKVVSSLGGLPHITPEFDSLRKEGLYFTNLYASGDRSDKGLVSLLSGYPAQPISSIITIPTKTSTLPSLPKSFKAHGYSTAFYYGGETEFANIKSYLLQQGFERIVDKPAFRKKDRNSKWGAHDHVVFHRLLSDLDTISTPFFTTVFTLSSHEPFEVPVRTVIPGNDITQKFLNSHHYTDASLGTFIRQARTRPWWHNTLIIVVADHGHPLPRISGSKLSEFRIPMLWLGGALTTPHTVCEALGSQIDLASTLLHQVNIPGNEFTWSNNLFRTDRIPYAFFSFNNGFGWVTPHGALVFDNVGKIEREKKGKAGPLDTHTGLAYQQRLFGDFLNR